MAITTQAIPGPMANSIGMLPIRASRRSGKRGWGCRLTIVRQFQFSWTRSGGAVNDIAWWTYRRRVQSDSYSCSIKITMFGGQLVDGWNRLTMNYWWQVWYRRKIESWSLWKIITSEVKLYFFQLHKESISNIFFQKLKSCWTCCELFAVGAGLTYRRLKIV